VHSARLRVEFLKIETLYLLSVLPEYLVNVVVVMGLDSEWTTIVEPQAHDRNTAQRRIVVIVQGTERVAEFVRKYIVAVARRRRPPVPVEIDMANSVIVDFNLSAGRATAAVLLPWRNRRVKDSDFDVGV
jgi:hypothetical protein